MASQGTPSESTQLFNEAYDKATQISADAVKFTSEAFVAAAASATALGQIVAPAAFRKVEEGTQKVGEFVTPIAEHPWIKYASKVPGINWLFTALGQVDVEQAQKEVDLLQLEYSQETSPQIAHRIMVDTAFKAGGVGLLTNFVPPLALTLFAVDLAAITTLQAEMVYRIAAAYGFSLKEPTRRGEVLAVFGLSMGSSGPMKLGLSFVELLPVVGAFVGASSNAALIYSLGYVACRFYEAKRNYLAQADGSENVVSSARALESRQNSDRFKKTA